MAENMEFAVDIDFRNLPNCSLRGKRELMMLQVIFIAVFVAF